MKIHLAVFFSGIAFSLLASPLAYASTPDGPWLRTSEYGQLRVVVSRDADALTRQAAEEFAAHWEAVTGHRVGRGGRGIPVYIGSEGEAARLAGAETLAELGHDGIVVRTMGSAGGGRRSLVLSGSAPRGPLYAVYEFLERSLGVRWLTPEVTHIPAAPEAIEQIDLVYTPPLARRTMGYAGSGWRSLVNGGRITEEERNRTSRRFRLSGEPRFGDRWVHSSFLLLPPREYFLEHPEYYSKINGERRGPVIFGEDGTPEFLDHLTPNEMGALYPDLRTQLCYSKPEVAALVAAHLRERMAAVPDARLWSVSQEDWDYPCECADCRAIDTREGSFMGSLLTGVNRVAEQIAEQFPENYVETLAYSYSRRPPATLRPAENVLISLCNIECNMIHPMDDPATPLNREFGEDLAGWAALDANMLFWDYPDNCINGFIKYPNFHVLQTNMQRWVEAGAWGGYQCGGETPDIGLGALRAYLLAKLMWDPYCDYEALKSEFLALYYGAAAPHVARYMKTVLDEALARDALVHVHDYGDWIGHDLVVRCDAILREAMAAADTPDTRARARKLWVMNQFNAIFAQPRVSASASHIELWRPDTIGVAAIAREMRGWDMADYFGTPFEDAYAGWAFNEKLPRHAASPILKISNRHGELWIAPALSGSVVRWRDKASGLDLFDDVTEQPAPYRFLSYQEWNTGGSAAPEVAAATRYEVVSHTADAMTLRAELPSGLTLYREMRLLRDRPGLSLRVRVENPGDAPVEPNLKLHPEFFGHHAGHPIILVKSQDGTWSEFFHERRRRPEILTEGRLLRAADWQKWGFYIPELPLYVENTFSHETAEGLLVFYGTFAYRSHVNLEVIMDNAPLPPGASRVLESTYTVHNAPPSGYTGGAQ